MSYCFFLIQTENGREWWKTNRLQHFLIMINRSSPQLYIQKAPHCIAMFMLNLVEPYWMSIPCDKKLFCHIVCVGNVCI